MHRLFAALMFLCLSGLAACASTGQVTHPQGAYRLECAGPVPGLPCERNFTVDRFGRRIEFYLYIPEAAKATPLPLVVFIQGSGCRSLFGKDPKTGQILDFSGHSVIPEALGGRAVTMVVEKPTVKFLDPDAGEAPPPESFSKEHTLERWSEAVVAAVRAARESPVVDGRKVLVVGHSEGGLVASKVAHDLPGVVTHVACAAGGGPTFLFDILSLARSGAYFGEVSDKPQERVRWVLDEWRKIETDPTSTKKHFFGHSYRYWSSFLSSSPMEWLATVDARIYIAQGTEDNAVDPVSADILYADLVVRGKQVVYDRVEGADHSFGFKDNTRQHGWPELYTRIVEWFLGP